jgi:hypothetical protein
MYESNQFCGYLVDLSSAWSHSEEGVIFYPCRGDIWPHVFPTHSDTLSGILSCTKSPLSFTLSSITAFIKAVKIIRYLPISAL